MDSRQLSPLSLARFGLWPVISRELRIISQSRFLFLFVFVLPLANFGILGAIFYQETPRDLSVLVCDQDNSALSRKLTRFTDASPSLKVAGHVQDMEEGSDMIRQGRAYALIFLPVNLERDFLRGKSPAITVYFNNQSLLTSGVINRSIRDVFSFASAGADMHFRMTQGESPPQAAEHFEPIRFDQHVLYNPGINYRQYLLPALLPTILQIFIVTVIVRTVGGELRHGTADDLMAAAGGRTWVALLGKMLPYTMSFSALGLFMWVLLERYFAIPIRGNLPFLLAGTLAFILAYQSMGCLMVGLTGSLRTANTMAGFYCGPAFAFAGVTYPLLALPFPARCWSYSIPLTHYIKLVMQQGQQGVSIHTSATPLLVLLAFAVLPPLVFLPRMGHLMRNPSLWGRT